MVRGARRGGGRFSQTGAVQRSDSRRSRLSSTRASEAIRGGGEERRRRRPPRGDAAGAWGRSDFSTVSQSKGPEAAHTHSHTPQQHSHTPQRQGDLAFFFYLSNLFGEHFIDLYFFFFFKGYNYFLRARRRILSIGCKGRSRRRGKRPAGGQRPPLSPRACRGGGEPSSQRHARGSPWSDPRQKRYIIDLLKR